MYGASFFKIAVIGLLIEEFLHFYIGNSPVILNLCKYCGINLFIKYNYLISNNGILIYAKYTGEKNY